MNEGLAMAEMVGERTNRAALSRPSARRVVRYALRGLVVAGVAGTAWLFWSTSAQAAPTGERDASGPDGTVTGLLFRTDPSARGVTVNQAAADPITTLVPLPAVVGKVVRVAEPVLVRATQPAARVAEPVTRLTAPLTRAVQPVVQPAGVSTGQHPPVVRTAGHRPPGPDRQHTRHTGAFAPGADKAPATTVTPDSSHAAAVPAVAVDPAARGDGGSASTRGLPATSPVGGRAGPESQPARLPAPPPAVPGAGLNGASATTPGSTSDGGATAVLPHRFAAGAVARHRTIPAADVAARPLTALVPTASPD